MEGARRLLPDVLRDEARHVRPDAGSRVLLTFHHESDMGVVVVVKVDCGLLADRDGLCRFLGARNQEIPMLVVAYLRPTLVQRRLPDFLRDHA
jgi:hypothetical protein